MGVERHNKYIKYVVCYVVKNAMGKIGRGIRGPEGVLLYEQEMQEMQKNRSLKEMRN